MRSSTPPKVYLTLQVTELQWSNPRSAKYWRRLEGQRPQSITAAGFMAFGSVWCSFCLFFFLFLIISNLLYFKLPQYERSTSPEASVPSPTLGRKNHASKSGPSRQRRWGDGKEVFSFQVPKLALPYWAHKASQTNMVFPISKKNTFFDVFLYVFVCENQVFDGLWGPR